MFLNGEQFDVGVADALHVFDQLHGHFAIGQRFAGGSAHPGFEVNLIQGKRLAQP